jgi:hypothetical protein
MKHDERPVSKGNPVCDITGFLRLLKEMEDAGETERMISGDYDGPFFSKAAYNCLIRIGLEGKRSQPSNLTGPGNIKNKL